MGKISNYTRVLKAKLQDVFAIDSTDNNVTTTKSVTVEQIGDAICGEQVHSDLETDDQTIIGGINENKDKVGDLSSLTTTNKDSLVDAVNEVNANKAEIKYIELSGTTNPNGLLSFDRNKKIVSAICTTANYVLFQIQDYVIVKHYNTFAIITGEAVKFDVYYYEP